MESVCDRQTAEADFERWVGVSRIVMDVEGREEDDVRDKGLDKIIIIKAIQDGRLVIDEEGQAIFTPLDRDPLTFRKPHGRIVASMDKVKSNHDGAKALTLIASLTGTNRGTIGAMEYADFSVCESIVNLFLAK
jgi:hypothetical protein